MSNLFTVSWSNVKGALISALLMAVVAMITYVLTIGSIFKIDWSHLVDIGVLSLLTGVVSIIKNFFTDSNGNLLGAVAIK